MLRAFALAALVLGVSAGLGAQSPTVLHIRVTVVDGDRPPVPVARHTLLISSMPVAAAPRRTITSADGTVDVPLRPGSYIIESDRPATLFGRSYQWMHAVEVAGEREMTLDLNNENATVEAATLGVPADVVPEIDESSILRAWQSSVAALWTARTHASGFLVDGTGLVVTNQGAMGEATSVDVQFSPTLKVRGRVLVADAERDVAVLWIDPAVLTSIKPVPLDCTGGLPITDSQDLLAIEVPIRRPAHLVSDLYVSPHATGGPVFTPNGILVGLTSAPVNARATARVVSAAALCQVLASAKTKMTGQPPAGTLLPVESERPVSATALDTLSRNSAFTINPYRFSSPDFDIAFLTPMLLARAQSRQEWMTDREDKSGVGAVTDFGDWSEYVAGYPPVLLVRVTPRLVENFWMKVARGAAETQGVAMPPIKRMRPGFAHMRLSCGGKDVTPIHQFKVQRRISETEGIDEGLYAFDPAAIGPHCGSVTLELFAAKTPQQGDTQVVAAAIVRRIAEDFSALSSD